MIENFLLTAGWLLFAAAFGFRLLTLAERWLALLEKASAPPPPKPTEPVPLDLLAFARQEQTPWAQEDVRKRLGELYAELGDWNKVRYVIAQEAAQE